jgi:hypothetical protein
MRRAAAVALLLLFPAAAPADGPDLTGTWSGYWVSDTNGHRGPLKAKFRQTGEDCYKVTFRGRFRVVIPFWYRTTMHVVGSDGCSVALAAEKNLGPRFGTFRMDATATDTSFNSTFQARGDHGRFVMTRRR